MPPNVGFWAHPTPLPSIENFFQVFQTDASAMDRLQIIWERQVPPQILNSHETGLGPKSKSCSTDLHL